MAARFRADAGGPFKEFVLTEWLRDCIEESCSKMKQGKEQLEPANVRRHIRTAQKEQLLAMRDFFKRGWPTRRGRLLRGAGPTSAAPAEDPKSTGSKTPQGRGSGVV